MSVTICLAGFLLTLPSLAWGTPFTRLTCPLCPVYQQVPFSYVALQPIGGVNWDSSELDRDNQCDYWGYNDCPHYQNHLDVLYEIGANYYARKIDFLFSEVDIDYPDVLYYGRKGDPLNWTWGTYTNQWLSIDSGYSFQYKPGQVHFLIGPSGTARGYKVTQARVCCNSSPISGSILVEPFRRLVGVLLGTGDSVLYKIPTSPTNHQTVVLWGNDSNHDFDIYLRCNAEPARETYGKSSTGATNDEEVELLPNECAGNWYLIVTSYRGAGDYSLMVSRHLPVAGHHYVKVGTAPGTNIDNLTNCAPWANCYQQVADTLRKGLRRFYAMTEGTQFAPSITFYNNQTCPNNCGGETCDICVMNEDAGCTGGGPYVQMKRWCWGRPSTLAHELAHFRLNLGDEYWNSYKACGHSAMTDTDDRIDMCYDSVHTLDRDYYWDPVFGWQLVPATSENPANWTKAYNYGHVPWTPYYMPDRYAHQTKRFPTFYRMQ